MQLNFIKFLMSCDNLALEEIWIRRLDNNVTLKKQSNHVYVYLFFNYVEKLLEFLKIIIYFSLD